MLRILFPALIAVASLWGADPRPKAADYPAHVDSEALSIGAEYLVHSFSNGSQMYTTPLYLVVDTAIYPHAPVEVKRSQFSLKVTLQGKSKQGDETIILHPETPQMVAYSITSSINSVPPELRGVAGQQSGQQNPFPRPPGLSGTDASGTESVEDVVTRMSLPEDLMHSGQGGYLYFAFSGKTKKIKGMDLVYGQGDGALDVKLF